MAINRFKQKVKGRWYEFGQFVTLTHSSFTELRKMFYRGRKKIVPKNIFSLLKTPLSLAVWIMDDGAKDNAGLTIQTHNFSREEVKKLAKVLKENFKLVATLRKNKGKTILYFPQSLPIVHSRFYGIKPAPAGIGYNFVDWFVPQQMQKYYF